jgi:hypothetical protein
MQGESPDLLEVLKGELEFLDGGMYLPLARNPWRAQFLLEDSPSCLHYGVQSDRQSCRDCVLKLVPLPQRDNKSACRYIVFNSDGQTLDSLYRSASQAEAEDVFRKLAVLYDCRSRRTTANGRRRHGEDDPGCDSRVAHERLGVKTRPLNSRSISGTPGATSRPQSRGLESSQ